MALELGLAGTSVLVTGGARGVGAGIVRTFLRAGATVVFCARREPDHGIEVDGATAEFRPCDVREPDQVETLISGLVDDYGRLDVLVNNAGGAPYADAATASPRFHDKIVALNLLAPLTMSQRANAAMCQQESGGSIINISSVSGSRPSPGTSSYGAAKAGLASLTSTLAVEWAPRVRVNALEVGMVRTEGSGMHYGGEEGIAAVGSTVPIGRLAEPEEVGACAAFLASPLASYVTGATLTVHGGGELPAFLAASTAQNGGKFQ